MPDIKALHEKNLELVTRSQKRSRCNTKLSRKISKFQKKKKNLPYHSYIPNEMSLTQTLLRHLEYKHLPQRNNVLWIQQCIWWEQACETQATQEPLKDLQCTMISLMLSLWNVGNFCPRHTTLKWLIWKVSFTLQFGFCLSLCFLFFLIFDWWLETFFFCFVLWSLMLASWHLHPIPISAALYYIQKLQHIFLCLYI